MKRYRVTSQDKCWKHNFASMVTGMKERFHFFFFFFFFLWPKTFGMVANGSERGANKKSRNVTETERGKFLVYFTTWMTRLIHGRDVQCQRQGIDNREKLC